MEHQVTENESDIREQVEQINRLIKKYNPTAVIEAQLQAVDVIIKNRSGICKTKVNGITTNTYLAASTVLNPRPYNAEELKEVIEYITEKNIGAIITLEQPMGDKVIDRYKLAGVPVSHLDEVTPNKLMKTFNKLIDTCINLSKPVLFSCKTGTRVSPYVLSAFCMYMLYSMDNPKYLPITLSLDTFFIIEAMAFSIGIKSDIVANNALLKTLLEWEYELKTVKISQQTMRFVLEKRIDLSSVYNIMSLSKDLIHRLDGGKTLQPVVDKKIKSPDISVLKDIIRPKTSYLSNFSNLDDLDDI